MMERLGNRRGFTLLEFVVTMMIFGFIGAVVTGTAMYGVKIYRALQTDIASASQVKVSAQAVKRLVTEHTADDIYEVQKQFRLEDGTVYWNGKVFLEGVESWSIQSEVLSVTGVSGGYSSYPVIHFTVVLKNPGGDALSYKYEFHPEWEPAK